MEYGCEFQVLSKELNEKLFEKRTPLSGGIEITSKCNFKCVHCYESIERDMGSVDKMSIHQLHLIIDELKDMGCISVFLTGGEAMLDKNFDDIYSCLRKSGIMVAILSNGTSITKEKCQLFQKYAPRMIDISLYGACEETYKKVTRTDDSYEKVIKGMDLLNEYKIPFQLKAIVLKDNVHELDEMRKLALEYNVPIKIFTGIRPYNDGTKSPMTHMLSNEDIIELESRDTYIRDYYDSKKDSFVAKGLSERQKNCNTYLCRIAQNSFFITYNGMLQGCVRSRYHGYNLQQGCFREGWKYLYDNFVNPTKDNEFPCSVCEIMNYCDFCPGEFEIETGNPTCAPEHLCKLAHMRKKKFG